MGKIRVEAYSGYKGNERPLRFMLGDRTYEVRSIQDQWYSPASAYFRVLADDGNYYVLRHDQGEDIWTLDAFRASQ